MKGRNNLRTFKNRTSINIDDLSLFYKKENIFNLKKKYSDNDLIHNFIFDIYRKNITKGIN